ncbi:RNA-directed DNA polymerase, eukaryota [Tanacetum coccineum]
MEIPADSDSNMEENNWDENDEEGVEDTFHNMHNAADDMKDVSLDLFGLNELIKRTTKDNILVEENEPDFPPGFTLMGNYSNTKNEKHNTLNIGGEEQIPSKDNDVNEAFDSIEESHNGKDDHETKENREELVLDKESVKETDCNSHSFRDESLARTNSILECFSMLNKFIDVIIFEQAIGFDMKGWVGRKEKKNWVRNLCTTNNLKFLSIQETKNEKFSSIAVRALWGNSYFGLSMASAIGRSCGILCTWDKGSFSKHKEIIESSFIVIEGHWISTSTAILLISVCAPQDFNEKKLPWNRHYSLKTGWNGETIIMGDFNEVRWKHERHRSIFHRNQAQAFDDFISHANLIDISLGGLVLMIHLSDHRHNLLHEVVNDYGATPFRLFHSWFLEPVEVVENSWGNDGVSDTNDIVHLKNKLKALKN